MSHNTSQLTSRFLAFIGILFALVAAACLIGAFLVPILTAHFEPTFPAWLPDWQVPLSDTSIHTLIRRWLIEQGRIPVGPQYLGELILHLLRSEDWLVGAAVALFSVFFPCAKIILALWLGIGVAVPAGARRHIASMLKSAGRWSMADVFIVALVIVFFKADGFGFQYEASTGIYLYGASALLSAWGAGLVAQRSLLKGSTVLESTPNANTATNVSPSLT